MQLYTVAGWVIYVLVVSPDQATVNGQQADRDRHSATATGVQYRDTPVRIIPRSPEEEAVLV